MGTPRTYHFKLPPYRGAPLPEPPGAWYPGVKPHWASCTSERTQRGDGVVRAVVIHATAGSSSAGAMSVLFAHQASWHWLVPDENESAHGRSIWACVPERRAAWHVRPQCAHADVNGGSNNVNAWSLGVEVVNCQAGGRAADPFSDWQVEQTAALVRYAWSKYPQLVDVVAHAKLDPTRRSDPGANFPWDRFREIVLAAPAPMVVAAPYVAPGPIHVLSPSGERIACDARMLEGVTVVEARPLIEALGFSVAYDDGPPMTMRIERGAASGNGTRETPAAHKRSAGGTRKATTKPRKTTRRKTAKATAKSAASRESARTSTRKRAGAPKRGGAR